MTKRLFTTCIITICMAFAAHAALIPEMKFTRLDTPDGLSNSQVTCVFKDSKGFVWIGTPYGLNRYDGYRFKTFYSNMRDTTTLRDNYVDRIYEAYDGRLWMRQGMNYCIYDPLTEHCERNVSKELSKFGIDGSVDYLFIDSKKNFWVKIYEKGFYYYNPKTKRLHLFKDGYGPQEVNPTWGISELTEFGETVIATSNCGEMLCMNGEKGWISWQNKWIRRNGGWENQSYRAVPDQEGNLFVHSPMYTFIYIQKQHRWYKTLPDFLRANGFENVPEKLQVWDILIDRRRGWIWAATDHDGLLVFDLKTRQLRQFLNNKLDPSTISDNTLRNIYQDPQGQIWIGTYKNGVNEYKESMSSIRTIELGDITTTAEDRYGNYWLGTNDRGILVYNPKTGEVLQHYTAENSGLNGNIVVGSCVARDGSLWFGSYNGGLSHAIPTGDKAAGQATIVNYQATGQPDALANNNVWSVTEDKWHRIWICTLGSGVQMLDLKTGKFRTWNSQNSKLPGDYLSSSAWTKKGWLLVGTSYFYSILNPVKGKLINYDIPGAQELSQSSSSTSAVIEDSRGLIWQGSTSGAIIHDPVTKQTELLDMTKGLYGSSVCSFTEDKKHAIWVVTDHGVSRVIPTQREDLTWEFAIQSFNSADGLQQSTYNQRSASLTRNGLLLIGGQGGLDIINPDRIKNGRSNEKPVLSGLLLFEKPVPVGEKFEGRVVLEKALSETKKLNLRYSENNFTIQLGSNTVNIKNTRRFIYKLDGFSDTWVKTSVLNPNINFMSLRSGDYTLRVRMLNADETMSDVETTLKIHISEPLWRTRWALLLYVLAVAVGVWFWRKRFLRRQKERMQLEQLRRETEKKQWMAELRRQMETNQSSFQQPAADSEELELSKSYTNLVDLVKQTVNGYKLPEGKHTKLSFKSTADSLSVDIDVYHFERALQILLANSVKFTPNDGKVQVLVSQPQPKQAEICIADNGIGIPEEARDHVFDPIPDEDSDLGLDQVKRIIDAHHGTVAAKDNPGGGTQFVIQLPLEEEIEIEEAVIIEDDPVI